MPFAAGFGLAAAGEPNTTVADARGMARIPPTDRPPRTAISPLAARLQRQLVLGLRDTERERAAELWLLALQPGQLHALLAGIPGLSYSPSVGAYAAWR